MYSPDLTNVFTSDVHRRVLGFTNWDAQPLDEIVQRIKDDPYTGANEENEILEVLKDHEADGYVTQDDDGWTLTSAGLDAIEAPPEQQSEDDN